MRLYRMIFLSTMAELGRFLIILGGTIFVIGLLLYFGGRLPWFGSLPGDIVVRRDNFTLYVPLLSLPTSFRGRWIGGLGASDTATAQASMPGLDGYAP